MESEYGDGLPILAGGFLSELKDGDLEKIIGGLGENIEPSDKDLDEKGYDTDEIEKRKEEKKYKKRNKIIILDNLSSDSSDNDDDLAQTSDDDIGLIKIIDPVKELEKRMAKVSGGGNVLQILVNLIPEIFPKSYA